MPPPPPPLHTALRIIREGPDFVVIDKPAGLLSVPGKGDDKQDCVPARIRAMFPRADGPLVVHRLDMDTSGLLVVGLTADAQRFLSREFEERRVEKSYTALIEGTNTPEAGLIDLPMRLDPDRRPYQVIDFIHGRSAQTRYRVLARETDRTRIRFEPITGRTHQLRIHAAAPLIVKRDGLTPVPGGLNAPILGDVLYGSGCDSGIHSAARLMLHASELRFKSPGGEWIECASSPEF